MTGKRIRMLRQEAGLTQTELGKFVGVGQPAIIAYERGTSTPPRERLVTMAELFDVSLDYLLGVSDERQPVVERSTELDDELQTIIQYLRNGKMKIHGLTLDELSADIVVDGLNYVLKVAAKITK